MSERQNSVISGRGRDGSTPGEGGFKRIHALCGAAINQAAEQNRNIISIIHTSALRAVLLQQPFLSIRVWVDLIVGYFDKVGQNSSNLLTFAPP